MEDQVKAPWKPEYRDTWKVAGNELTWLLRYANVDANAEVSKDGSFAIHYQLTDTLDLRPSAERSYAYNTATTVLGFLYHDIARGTEMKLEANWTSTY